MVDVTKKCYASVTTIRSRSRCSNIHRVFVGQLRVDKVMGWRLNARRVVSRLLRSRGHLLPRGAVDHRSCSAVSTHDDAARSSARLPSEHRAQAQLDALEDHLARVENKRRAKPLSVCSRQVFAPLLTRGDDQFLRNFLSAPRATLDRWLTRFRAPRRRSRWLIPTTCAIVVCMGVSIWTFVRPRPGELHPVTQRAVDEFISNAGRLPADHDGFVRYAQVVVNLENRRAVEVLQMGFYQHRVRKNGKLDRKHFKAVMATIGEAAFGGLRLDAPPPGVVAAEHRFAKRRLDHLSTWKPTQDDLAELRDVVNHKARRETM